MKYYFIILVAVFLSLPAVGHAQKKENGWEMMDKAGWATVKDSGRYCAYTCVFQGRQGTDVHDTIHGFTVTRGNSFHFEARDSLGTYSSYTKSGNRGWFYDRKFNGLCYGPANDSNIANVLPFMNCNKFNDLGFITEVITRSLYDSVPNVVLLESTDPKSKYKDITVSVHRSAYRISKMVVRYKDGRWCEMQWTYLGFGHSIPDSVFTYDPKRYPGVDIEDNVNGCLRGDE